ncbi:MAG: PspA-associated protein PspAB [Acidimicrobiales bacterium]
MGLFDTLLGRTKPVRPNLDNMFALSGAAVTLQVSAGLVSTHKAGVCFKPPAGQPFAEMQAQIEQLLRTPDQDPQPMGTVPGPTASPSSSGASNLSVRDMSDSFGYRWILIEGGEIEDLVTRVHMVHSSLEDGGWSTQLLCSVFGFSPGGGQSSGNAGTSASDSSVGTGAADSTAVSVTLPVFLVYLAKRGTFYPFVPCGKEKRDTEVEMLVRSVLGNDLPIDADLSHWFPIWDLPIA